MTKRNLLFVTLFTLILSSVAIASEFSNPQRVDVNNLPPGKDGTRISTEEPFISRDGQFLFFNTGQNENNKDLHFARLVKGQWVYQGEIGPGVNNRDEVQGNPTMDQYQNFFYIDSGRETMVRTAKFNPSTGELSELRDLAGIPRKNVQLFKQKIHGNMGVEISADGELLFFSRATWELEFFSLGMITDADILFLKKQGKKFIYNEKEAKQIMRHVNSDDLNYAACISKNGLEFFFTRLATEDIVEGKLKSRIMRATRPNLSSPFGRPEVIQAIGVNDFVEGPALSADEKELYYHKKEQGKFRLYKVNRL